MPKPNPKKKGVPEMIDGVMIKELKVLSDERGALMEMLRDDDPMYERFGQVYMTICDEGAAKAWHYHKKQNDHFVCVSGVSLVVLYDGREDSPTRGEVNEFVLEGPREEYTGREVQPDEKGKLLVRIPKGVMHGFAALGCPESRIVNVPTYHYEYEDPDEHRLPWDTDKVPYVWPSMIEFGG